MTVIANVEVRRILLDSGSSVDVLFYEAYQGMGIENNMLMPHYTPLVRFVGGIVHTMGEILFPLSIAEEPKRQTHMAKFLVVDSPYHSYNSTLGRLTLNALQAVISTLCLKIKFPAPAGIEQVQGSQSKAQEC